MESSKIALVTDFGLEDPYVGVMKGVIASINPFADIIDITHKIQPQNIYHAAFSLLHTYCYFPSGTIFVIVVDPGVGSQRKALAVKTHKYFFIAPDNGLLSPVLEQQYVERIVNINNSRYLLTPPSDTFHGRDVFAPAAAHLSHGLPIENLGDAITTLRTEKLPEVKVFDDHLEGRIIVNDHFGNLISNISKNYLQGKIIKSISVGDHLISRINRAYNESSPGELLAIIGSYDTLEIAVNRGSADAFLGEHHSEIIRVYFDKYPESENNLY